MQISDLTKERFANNPSPEVGTYVFSSCCSCLVGMFLRCGGLLLRGCRRGGTLAVAVDVEKQGAGVLKCGGAASVR